ncbi:DUF4157 domain-containing protein [Chitinophaga sp. CB10]|uniref:DUF4157 domain-containing protein n=1 Tax=Chitinophaga sp. CB10 TaxID=1891659 RepID=UPI0025BE5925|nr:DUF4157 domain-containing protein [Chitinophaga sp. CB10]
MEKIKVRIHERSLLALLAAKRLKVPAVAMVMGDTIHLHGVSRDAFLADTAWVRHEVCHVRQFRQWGFLSFLYHYFRDYLRNGYVNNSFEVAARAAESDPTMLEGVEIH